MINRFGILLAAAAVAAAVPTVHRQTIVTIEKGLDSRIARANPDNPMDVIVNSRGVYVPGYGTVFTSEVNLVSSPNVTPFRQTFSAEETARWRERKLRQLPLLKRLMREILLDSAHQLSAMPPREQVALGVSLFYWSWEDKTGLPSQVVMHGEVGKLLARTGAENAIQTEEY